MVRVDRAHLEGFGLDDVFIVGAGEADFEPVPGRTALELASVAVRSALEETDLDPRDIDGFLTGYSLTDGHFMFADAAAEYLGVDPQLSYTINSGGATGCLLVRNAVMAIRSGEAKNVVVVWADNRISGSTRSDAVSKLSQTGHPGYEVPYRGTIASFYALYASRYLHEWSLDPDDLAEVAVTFRAHAALNASARMRTPLTVAEVVRAKSIAPPLRLLDCCLVTDFGGALILSADPTHARFRAVRVAGTGGAHPHEHVSQAETLSSTASGLSALGALGRAELTVQDLDFAQLYDCFTITVVMQIEDMGLAPRGQALRYFKEGRFGLGGELPLNTNGGMLSGVNGGIHHVVEAVRQLQGRAGERQVAGARAGLVHGIGGIMSSHCSLVLTADDAR